MIYVTPKHLQLRAVQWFKDGDHLSVKAYSNRPEYEGCGNLKGFIVNPGDFIVELPGEGWQVFKLADFHRRFDIADGDPS